MAVLLGMGLNVLTQNIAAALPAKTCKLFVDGAPTLQHSTTEAFTANIPIVLVDGQAEVAGGFIRSTGAPAANIWISYLS